MTPATRATGTLLLLFLASCSGPHHPAPRADRDDEKAPTAFDPKDVHATVRWLAGPGGADYHRARELHDEARAQKVAAALSKQMVEASPIDWILPLDLVGPQDLYLAPCCHPVSYVELERVMHANEDLPAAKKPAWQLHVRLVSNPGAPWVERASKGDKVRVRARITEVKFGVRAAEIREKDRKGLALRVLPGAYVVSVDLADVTVSPP